MARGLSFLILIECTYISVTISDQFPFRNVTLPWEQRVDDLVGRLSVEEIVLQLSKGGAGLRGGPAPPVTRLGIKQYQWNTECLRGDALAPGRATSFPQAIGLAAAFSKELIYNVSEVTGLEVRAKHNYFAQKGIYDDHTGVSCFSPVINIMRHPLWGRSQETYGEDPYLSGMYAANFVTGLQGHHSRYIAANAGCKHFDVHGGPENIPVSRMSFDAKVTERDWRTTFLPQFKMCVQAGTYSVMCSYNSINGIPACANKKLLTYILRDEWGFKGYVVSDEAAIENIITYHKYLNTSTETAAACINAGTNLELSNNITDIVYLSLPDALSKGLVTKETLITRVKPLFYTRMRLGEFDPDEMNPYAQLDLNIIQSPQHRELSIRAACMSFVLLKNDDNFLPLKTSNISMSIVGPMANNPGQMFGDYSPTFDPTVTLTPYQGFKNMVHSLHYYPGCNETACKAVDFVKLQETIVSAPGMAVVCLGTGVAIESENKDRTDLRLPGKQENLLKAVLEVANVFKIPVIVLLFNAGPLDIGWLMNQPQIKAIFACFYPAQGTGEALMRTVFWSNQLDSGQWNNPAGRLPMTWPSSMNQVPPMTNYTMQGRTYRYFNGEPLYPFGYGLSYTYFNYDKLTVTPSKIKAGENVTVEVTVSNVGQYDGDEVIQIYISWDVSDVPSPKWQLVGFDRVHLEANVPETNGASYLKVVTTTQAFNITAEQMALWTDGRGFVVNHGTIVVYAGGQQPNQVKTVGSQVLKKHFYVSGLAYL